jgi:hypothetical protein
MLMSRSQKLSRTSKMKERHDKPTRGRLNRLRRLFDPSRYGAVLFILLTVGIYIAVRLTAPSGAQHAQLRFVEDSNAETSDVEAGSQVSYREPLSGPAYETAIRLREAGALGMAVSLAVFARHASGGNAPAAPHDVIREMAARKLLPPGIEIENGSFRSGVSELRFSYRSEPLSFEILALPKDGAAGSALLLRFPLPPSETNSVMYFESPNPAQVPAPFSTNEQTTAAGWRIRQWRGDALPLNEAVVGELREQDNWLKSINQGR